ncbi:MAG: polysaccharide biosynthesis C-terminal domain-containing protein [Verrucomicrobiales bacterium]
MARRDDPVTAPRLVAIADLHLSLLALGAIIAALFAGEIIMLIAPGEYLPAARYVPVLMGGALLGAAATVPATHLHFREKTGFLPLVFGLAAAANLAGNLIFVPQFGAIAAAFCFAAANAVAMVLLWRVSSPRRAVPYPSWRYALMLGLAALICLAPAFEDSPLPLALRLAVAAIFGSGVIAGVALPAVRRFGSYHPLAV